jgi:RNA polymerase-binding transcription factor DksA
MRHTHFALAKEALLKELDHTLQRDFRQTLNEILTELKIRNAVKQPVTSADSVFAAIRQSRILERKSTHGTIQMRAALERLNGGKFGKCSRCGRRIQELELRRDPLLEMCPSCAQSTKSN